MTATARPIPVPDAETAPFWEAAREGRLALQHCGACDGHVFYPRLLCPHCGSDALDWVSASGTGEIYAVTVVHKPPKGFEGEAPFAVGIVALKEGPRMMARIVAPDLHGLTIGTAVSVAFDRLSDAISLPVFHVCT